MDAAVREASWRGTHRSCRRAAAMRALSTYGLDIRYSAASIVSSYGHGDPVGIDQVGELLIRDPLEPGAVPGRDVAPAGEHLGIPAPLRAVRDAVVRSAVQQHAHRVLALTDRNPAGRSPTSGCHRSCAPFVGDALSTLPQRMLASAASLKVESLVAAPLRALTLTTVGGSSEALTDRDQH